MFSRKIDNPLKITLDYERLGRKEDDKNYFTDCDPIAGFVTLTLTEPQEVGKLNIRFYGVSKTSKKTPGSEGPSYRSAQPWLFCQDLSPPEVNRRLDIGVHTWSFAAAFPRRTAVNLVQDEEDSFNVSGEGFQHEAHPLPPSCSIKTGHTSGLDTSTEIWYAIDAEYTRIGGESGKLMKPTSFSLDYIPMAAKVTGEPIIKTVFTSEVLECRSVALNPNFSSDPNKSLSWRDQIHSKIHKESTPRHTFKFELLALEQYTIDKPMPIWLRVIHDPDGASSLLPEKAPPVYILKSSIKLWTWNHVRGTVKLPFRSGDDEGDVEDPVQWGSINYSYKSERKDKNNDNDPTNDVFAPPTVNTSTGMGTDLTKLGGVDYTWGRTQSSVPDFSTYNARTKQTIEVEVEVMVGGRKYDIWYQRQKHKWEKWLALCQVDCVSLVGGLTERQHQLKGEDDENGDIQWWLIGDDREEYRFETEHERKEEKPGVVRNKRRHI